MVIPKDLKRLARYFFFKRVIVFILILTITCVVTTLINNRMSEPVDIAYMTSSYIFCIFIALLIAGIPNKLFDKTFYGKVVKVDVKTTIDNSSSVKPTRDNLYYKNTVYLTIETYSGRTIIRKVNEAKVHSQSECDLYKVGDLVFHLYGTKHTIVIPNKSNDYVRCSVCGETNNKSETLCRRCKHTLIKSLAK